MGLCVVEVVSGNTLYRLHWDTGYPAIPDAAATGAINVELRLILQCQGALHHAQGVPAGPQRAGDVGGLSSPNQAKQDE